jgi:GNAT superfamily N-acetyltransferase
MTRLPAGDVVFREAVPSDALCIGVLATQVFLDNYATDGIRPPLAREVLESLSTDAISGSLSRPGSRFIVAESAGHMIAFAQVTLGATQALVAPEGAAEINRLYVQERFTGTGVGTALLRLCENWAAGQGVSTLWLTAWVGNSRARTFYASRGYQDVGSTLYAFQGESHENRVYARALRTEPAG